MLPHFYNFSWIAPCRFLFSLKTKLFVDFHFSTIAVQIAFTTTRKRNKFLLAIVNRFCFLKLLKDDFRRLIEGNQFCKNITFQVSPASQIFLNWLNLNFPEKNFKSAQNWEKWHHPIWFYGGSHCNLCSGHISFFLSIVYESFRIKMSIFHGWDLPMVFFDYKAYWVITL